MKRAGHGFPTVPGSFRSSNALSPRLVGADAHIGPHAAPTPFPHPVTFSYVVAPG